MTCKRCAGRGGGHVRFGNDEYNWSWEECETCEGTGRAGLSLWWHRRTRRWRHS